MNAISPSNTAVVYEVELATTQRGDADLPEASSPSGHCRVLRDLSLLCSPHRCHGDPRAEAEVSFVHLPTVIPRRRRPRAGTCSEGSTFDNFALIPHGHFTLQNFMSAGNRSTSLSAQTN